MSGLRISNLELTSDRFEDMPYRQCANCGSAPRMFRIKKSPRLNSSIYSDAAGREQIVANCVPFIRRTVRNAAPGSDKPARFRFREKVVFCLGNREGSQSDGIPDSSILEWRSANSMQRNNRGANYIAVPEKKSSDSLASPAPDDCFRERAIPAFQPFLDLSKRRLPAQSNRSLRSAVGR